MLSHRSATELWSLLPPRVASVDEVRRAIREAEFKRINLGSEGEVDCDLTRSPLERRFLRLCRHQRLPKPEVNVKIGPHEVDFLWREQRLVVALRALLAPK